jgi:hypothetical protein
MTNKENIVIYKNRIKNEIANLDPTEKDEYLIAECEYFDDYCLQNNISSESVAEMKSLLEYDRVLIVLKAQLDKERIIKKAEKKAKEQKAKDDWQAAPMGEKLFTIALGVGILSLIFWAIL